MSGKSDLVDMEVALHAETEKAVRVSASGDEAEAVWIPKPQCEIERTVVGNSCIITLPEWLAQDKGLI